MKQLLSLLLLIAILFTISACYYTKNDLAEIVDEKLEEPLFILYSYFEKEGEYSFSEAKEAYNTLYDVIYRDFY